jgi:hypothetical protein
MRGRSLCGIFSAALEFQSCPAKPGHIRNAISHLDKSIGKTKPNEKNRGDFKSMKDRNKMDQNERMNRNRVTEKKPVQGSQDIHRQQQGNVEQDQSRQRQREHKDREKKPA